MLVALVILAILNLLGGIITMQRTFIMAYSLSDIENAITAQNTVIDSVAVLLNQLTEELTTANSAGDQDGVSRIIGEIQANTTRLTSAVTANTPGGVAVVTPVAPPVAAPVEAVETPPELGYATQTQPEPTPADTQDANALKGYPDVPGNTPKPIDLGETPAL